MHLKFFIAWLLTALCVVVHAIGVMALLRWEEQRGHPNGLALLVFRPGCSFALRGVSFSCGDDAHRHPHRVTCHEQRTIDVVRWSARVDDVCDFRDDALPVASSIRVKRLSISRMNQTRSKSE